MPELPTGWNFPTMYVGENKGSLRTMRLNPQEAWELVGVDGSLEGGLRPFFGYKLVKDLGLTSKTVDTGDFFVKSVQIDATYSVTAYVYRYTSTAGGTAGQKGVLVTWYDGSSWTTDSVWSVQTGLTGAMDVVSVGRRLYIFIKGQEPRLVYWTESGGTVSLTLETDTGPSVTPTLYRPGESGASIGNLTNASGVDQNTQVSQVVVTSSSPASGGLYANEDDAEPMPGGTYAVAWMAYSTVTGQQSQLSDVVSLSSNDFDGTFSLPVDGYIALEMIVDTTKFDRIRIYRSTRDKSNTEISKFQGNLWLDTEIDITDAANVFADDSDPLVATNYAKIIWWFSLRDGELLYGETYYDRGLFDLDMPKGGAALLVNPVLLVSDISEATPDYKTGVGEIRYSSPFGDVEMFPTANRMIPPTYTDRVITWSELGPNFIGLSSSRLYFGRYEGGFLIIEEFGKGYGVVNARAHAETGEVVYYVHQTGLKMVASDGSMQNLTVFDYLFQNTWRSTISNVFMVHDPKTNTITIVNPSAEHAAMIWFNTGKATEVVDVPFVAGSTGLVPGTTETRAQFVTQGGLVYRLDDSREATGHRLLDFDGEANLTVSAKSESSGSTALVFSGTPTLDADVVGSYLYVTSGDAIWQKGKITAVSVGGYAVTIDDPSAVIHDAIAVGDRVTLGPVVLRWVGPALGLQDESGQSFGVGDTFRVRHAETIRAHFTNVTGDATTDVSGLNAIYAGLLYRGNSDSAEQTVVPTDAGDNAIQTVIEGEPKYGAIFGQYGVDGPLLFPGIQVVCADLDFYLIGAFISGKVLDTKYRGAR